MKLTVYVLLHRVSASQPERGKSAPLSVLNIFIVKKYIKIFERKIYKSKMKAPTKNNSKNRCRFLLAYPHLACAV